MASFVDKSSLKVSALYMAHADWMYDLCVVDQVPFYIVHKAVNVTGECSLEFPGNVVLLAPIVAKKKILIDCVKLIAFSEIRSDGDIDVKAKSFFPLGAKVESLKGRVSIPDPLEWGAQSFKGPTRLIGKSWFSQVDRIFCMHTLQRAVLKQDPEEIARGLLMASKMVHTILFGPPKAGEKGPSVAESLSLFFDGVPKMEVDYNKGEDGLYSVATSIKKEEATDKGDQKG